MPAAMLQAVAASKKECGKKATGAMYSDEVMADFTRSARHFGSGFKADKEYKKRHAEDQYFALAQDMMWLSSQVMLPSPLPLRS